MPAFAKGALKRGLSKIAGDIPAVIVTPDYVREMVLYGQNGGYSACRVNIYSEGDLYTLNGSDAEPLNSDLITVHTDKSLDAPAGSWAVTLHDRPIRQGANKGKRLSQVVRQSDLVTIAFKRSDADDTRIGSTVVPRSEGNDFDCVMVGLVGALPTTNWGVDEHGAATRHLTITGFDFGKLLLNNQIYYFKDVPSADIEAFSLKGWKELLDNGAFPAGTKASIFKKALDDIFFKTTIIKFKLKDGARDINDLLGYTLGYTYGQIPVSINFFSQEQTMQAFLDGVAEKPWCEFYVDTMPDDATFIASLTAKQAPALEKKATAIDGSQTVLVLRETPFQQDVWTKLPRFLISDDVIHTVAIGGEPTLYNLFYGKPAAYMGMGDIASAFLTGVPIFDHPSALKHGIRLMQAESKVFPWVAGPDDKASIEQVGRDLTERLYRWYQPSDRYLSGSFTVQGHPAYRIGCTLVRLHNVQETRGELEAAEFYIEGVTQDWSAFGEYRTQLKVTRGLYFGQTDRFPDPPTPNYNTPVSTLNIIATGGASA